MRIALDTNVVVYAEGMDDPIREARAIEMTSGRSTEDTFLPVQVLFELFNVLVKRGRSRENAKEAVDEWRSTFFLIPTSLALISSATDLAVEHKLPIWDAVILAAAAESRCDLLLSEDFQDGFAWRGVTVVNPFAEKPHKMLTKLLRG